MINYIPNYVLKIAGYKPFLSEKEFIPISYRKGGYEEAVEIMQNDLKINDSFSEHLWLLLMDSQNSFIGVSELSVGSQNHILIPIREIIITVLLSGASRFFLFHNHSTGVLEESIDDYNFANKIRMAIMGIDDIVFLDSIIMTPDGRWTSHKIENNVDIDEEVED